jgi:hypothetical protein
MTEPRHWILDRHDERTIALVATVIGVSSVVLGLLALGRNDRSGALWDGVVGLVSFGSAAWSIRLFRKGARDD